MMTWSGQEIEPVVPMPADEQERSVLAARAPKRPVPTEEEKARAFALQIQWLLTNKRPSPVEQVGNAICVCVTFIVMGLVIAWVVLKVVHLVRG